MTIKKLFMLGGVLAGAALLRNKERRDRLFGQVRDMLDNAKTSGSDVVDSSASSARPTDHGSTFGSSSAYDSFDGAGNYRPRTYR